MKEKTNYLSLLSVISALAVVILHTNGCFWKYSSERYWFTANIIESVMYFAVPVFFMISGATLIEYRKRYSTKEFFQKRIRKTLIPFLCFSIIGLFYQLYMGYIQVSDLNFWTVIDGILNVKYNETYWFSKRGLPWGTRENSSFLRHRNCDPEQYFVLTSSQAMALIDGWKSSCGTSK